MFYPPQGIRPNPDKVEAIKWCPTPCKIKQLRFFLGMKVTHTDTDEAIYAFPDLGAIRVVNETDLTGSIKQTKVQLGSNPQVITYQPSKPVKDLKHTGEIKIKAPNKLNARKERL